VALVLALAVAPPALTAGAANAQPVITIQTDSLAGPPLMGLGVEWDPYDSLLPTDSQWTRTFQRLDFMRPGFIRIVEPAGDYFKGYDSQHNPLYRWNAVHVVEVRKMLDYAKSRGISVILGDWSNPVIGGDARIPAEFLRQLHDTYGYTNLRYYTLVNEPNYLSNCDFGCWTGVMQSLSAEFDQLGLSGWLKLVGPDNANSWDDTAVAQANDIKSGLDTDNPIGGDSWVTSTLRAIPGLIRAYDSHRYATIWGIEHGVYQDQMRARREQISNLDSASKPYFEGEVGLTARQVTPFAASDFRTALARGDWQILAALVDPSATGAASSFVDSQPHIREFNYGVWMGDMMVQAIAAGLAGASAWDLDDAMHVGGQYGSQNLKQWGFWNSFGGTYGYPASDLRLRPWFYTWSVLARSFPSGSQALTTPGTGISGLRVAAARIPAADGFDLSVAIVNDADASRSLTVSVPSASGPVTLNRYDYFAGDRPVDGSGFALPAQVLSNVRLSGGVTIKLPSRGLVVLSSLGTGTSPLTGGRQTLVDGLDSWRNVSFHSSGMKLEHRQPALFNGDGSRAAATGKAAKYLIYREIGITDFELKTYYHKRLGIRVYGSRDGSSWTPIGLAATNPAPAIGGGWFLVDLLPGTALPVGTTQLKVTLTNTSTQLSQVNLSLGLPIGTA
jgi:hypothetical protein